MKRFTEKWTIFMLIAALLGTAACLPAAAEGHWADAYMQRAQGWIAAAFDEPPQPDDLVSGEQLLMMTCEAMGITPGSSFEDFILHGQRYPDDFYSGIPEQVKDSRMVARGYYLPATWFGFTRDISSSFFAPAERGNAFSMVTRGIGLLNVAKEYSNANAVCADWEQVNEAYQRRIGLLAECGIITGDAEGNVRINDPITVGEAAAVLCRAYDYMTEGMDAGIRMIASGEEMYGVANVEVPVPIQIVDDIVFVCARTLLQAGNWVRQSKPGDTETIFANNMTLKGVWTKDSQSVDFEYYTKWKGYAAGRKYYNNSGEKDVLSNRRINNRLLFGEVMIPVLDLRDGHRYNQIANCSFDLQAKVLDITPPYPNETF